MNHCLTQPIVHCTCKIFLVQPCNVCDLTLQYEIHETAFPADKLEQWELPILVYCPSCDGAQTKCFDSFVKIVLGKFQEQTFVVNFAVDNREQMIMQLKALCAVLQDQILNLTWLVGIVSNNSHMHDRLVLGVQLPMSFLRGF